MRIDTIRAGAITARGNASRSGSGTVFNVDEGAQTQRSQAAAPSGSVQDIGSLLALQSVEDPLLKKKKLVRRGTQMLDLLEDLKADLLVGQIDEGRLAQLQTLMAEARDKTDPRLDALLDDIELRVLVELAKRGR